MGDSWKNISLHDSKARGSGGGHFLDTARYCVSKLSVRAAWEPFSNLQFKLNAPACLNFIHGKARTTV